MPLHPDKNKGQLLTINLYLNKDSILHTREVFNLLDLIGDLGGVVEVLIIVIGVLLYPIS